MTAIEKARLSIEEAEYLLTHKPYESTLVERFFLIYEAWEQVKGLPQPLQAGHGLSYILNRASLPIRPYDLLLGRFEEHIPSPEEKEKLTALRKTPVDDNPITGRNVGHDTIDSDFIIRKGIPAFIREAAQKIERLKAENADESVIIYLEGVRLTFEAIRDYIIRYGKAAEAAGLADCAAVCSALAERAPETFREALQLVLFCYNIYLIYAGATVACLTVGRLDNYLLPFYLNDLQGGRMTEEEAGCYIDDFSAKMSLHLGRGEHQMAYLSQDYVQTDWNRNHVYESPGYILLGGYSNTSDQKTNPLTLLFARHIHPRLKNPFYICRYVEDHNEELWKILSRKAVENSSVLFYNDETVIPAHRHIGVEEEDAVNYSIHPCNWADIAGNSAAVGGLETPLPTFLHEVLHTRSDFDSMDELYEEIGNAYRQLVRELFTSYRAKYRVDTLSPHDTLTLIECFKAECIERAGNSARERLKYPALYMQLRAIGTAADMLSSVDDLVFRQKKYTLPELIAAADSDFENAPGVLRDCRKAPKYGSGNPIADDHACRLMNLLLDIIDQEAVNEQGVRDVFTLNTTTNDSTHLRQGAKLNATVDGRRKGQPLSENLSPTVGCAQGVTPLLNSVAKLPFDRIHSGVLNLRLSKSVMRGEHADQLLLALINTYFRQGGMQLQFSITDAEELKKAQEDPEAHRDLLVRITGYSAVFTDMCRGAQDEFIRREELQ